MNNHNKSSFLELCCLNGFADCSLKPVHGDQFFWEWKFKDIVVRNSNYEKSKSFWLLRPVGNKKFFVDVIFLFQKHNTSVFVTSHNKVINAGISNMNNKQGPGPADTENWEGFVQFLEISFEVLDGCCSSDLFSTFYCKIVRWLSKYK